MTVITHALTGAALMVALFPQYLGYAIVYGLIAGSIPDSLDWLLWWLSSKEWMRWLFPKPLPRWAITYGWFHHTLAGHLISLLLIAPFPHVMGDHLIHPPVLPRKGENIFLDEIIVDIKFLKLSRHDIFWCTGELAMVLFAIILVLI
jgi:hypothetical protein